MSSCLVNKYDDKEELEKGLPVIGTTVYWECFDGSIDSATIINITPDYDNGEYFHKFIIMDSEGNTNMIESHNCLPEDDPRVQEYIRKENEGLWIARDVNNTLLCHTGKPKCKHGYWYSSYMMIVNPDWYPEVTFENSPKKLRI